MPSFRSVRADPNCLETRDLRSIRERRVVDRDPSQHSGRKRALVVTAPQALEQSVAVPVCPGQKTYEKPKLSRLGHISRVTQKSGPAPDNMGNPTQP